MSFIVLHNNRDEEVAINVEQIRCIGRMEPDSPNTGRGNTWIEVGDMEDNVVHVMENFETVLRKVRGPEGV